MQQSIDLDISAIAPEEYLYFLQKIDLKRNILRDELAKLDTQFDLIVTKCNENNIKENDFLYLNCKVSERRSVHIPSFVKLFPEAAATLKEMAAQKLRMEFGRNLDDLTEKGLIRINVEDAENLVGRIPLEPAVVTSRKETYSIIEKNQNLE